MSLSLILRSYDFIKSITSEDLLLISRLIKIQLKEYVEDHVDIIEVSNVLKISNLETAHHSSPSDELNPFSISLYHIIEDDFDKSYYYASFTVQEWITGKRTIRCSRYEDRSEWITTLEKRSETSYIGEEIRIIEYKNGDRDIEEDYNVECHMIDNIPITCYILLHDDHDVNHITIVQHDYYQLTLYYRRYKKLGLDDIIEDDSSPQMVSVMKMMIEKYWK